MMFKIYFAMEIQKIELFIHNIEEKGNQIF